MLGTGIAAAVAALAGPAVAGNGPGYAATLLEDRPLQVRFQLELPGNRTKPTQLRLSPRSHVPFEGKPACDKGKLVVVHSGRWTAPPSCRAVSWTVPLGGP